MSNFEVVDSAEIARLRREVEALRGDRDSWEQQASDRVDDAVKFAKEADELRAEVASLRAKNNDLRNERRRLVRAHVAVHERLCHIAETAAQRDARVMTWRRLYVAANVLAMVVGRDGEINTKHPATDELMGVLRDLDDGTVDPALANALQRRPRAWLLEPRLQRHPPPAIPVHLGIEATEPDQDHLEWAEADGCKYTPLYELGASPSAPRADQALIERCARAAEAEHVGEHVGDDCATWGDSVYNRALRDAAAAIRALDGAAGDET